MILAEFKNIAITGIACCAPTHEETLEKYYAELDTNSVEKFSKTTGVIKRRIAEEKQTASDLAFIAAKTLLREKNVNPCEIGALIFITQTPDYRVPSTAFVLQKRLGVSIDSICFDVNLGCSGYTYGLYLLASIMETSNIERGLLLFGDTANKFINPKDKSACMLFGDGGGASLLEKREDALSMRMTFRSEGSKFNSVLIPAGGYRNRFAGHESRQWEDGCTRTAYDLNMNGTEVFSHMISEAPRLLKEYFTVSGKTVDDFDHLILHQANAFILKQIAKRVNCPMEKVPISMDRYGNTSVASIPFTIVDTCGDEKCKKGVGTFLLCGLGGGLSLGIADVVINTNDVLPMIYSDECFDDGIIK